MSTYQCLHWHTICTVFDVITYVRQCTVGYRFGPVDMDDAAPSTSYSGPEDGSFDREMYSYDLEITEESELDGEVGKRLNQMIPVPVSIACIKYNDIFHNLSSSMNV